LENFSSKLFLPPVNPDNIEYKTTIGKFYGQFNNILSVLDRGLYEMNAVHLFKTHTRSTICYGIEHAPCSFQW